MNKKVGEKIRQLRAVSGLSQDNVAEEIGMSSGNYGKIERGEIDVSSTHLMKIAKTLKVNVSDFFEEKKANIKETKTDYGFATKEELSEIAQAVQLLTKEIAKLREEIPSSKSSAAKPKRKYGKKK
ncbi:MAG: helix-turn-helix transcriptional regulator [Bacteroidota bacterium]|nr:helix-turn-helix transcriptional regulator [Bacteroidota bacterium]